MFPRTNFDLSRVAQGPNIFHANGNNYFCPLMNEIEFFRCNNFGHKASECRSSLPNSFMQHTQDKYNQQKVEKRWKECKENCEIDLISQGQHEQWLIDSGFSKHMTGDKRKFLQLKEYERAMSILEIMQQFPSKVKEQLDWTRRPKLKTCFMLMV